MTLTCRTLDARTAPAWDAFVTAHPHGTFFHLAGWSRVVTKTFGFTCTYLYTERDGAITGVLPLGAVKTLLFGHKLISAPFCVYGGPLATDSESLALLLAEAASLMQRTGAPVIELRQRDELPELDGWIAKPDLYVTFSKAITSDDDANMKAIPRKQRAMVRKGIGLGLQSVIDTDTTRLHKIYAESVRNLGTPVFAKKFFDILMQEFAGNIDIVTIMDGETAIASVMNFYFRNEVLPYYGGGRAIARERYGNDFMYWEVMRRAAARGCTIFDFGRSKLGTGAMAFKKNWGFEPARLHYRFRLAPGAEIPDHNPLNPKFRLFIAAWKHLPLPIAALLGPPIVRGLG